MRIGPSWVAGKVTREVNVTLWPPRERGYALARSLTWTPSDWQFLFPLLEGDLELAPIGPGLCRISLAATYTRRWDDSAPRLTAPCYTTWPPQPCVLFSLRWQRNCNPTLTVGEQ